MIGSAKCEFVEHYVEKVINGKKVKVPAIIEVLEQLDQIKLLLFRTLEVLKVDISDLDIPIEKPSFFQLQDTIKLEEKFLNSPEEFEMEYRKKFLSS
jgi:hypothetical protein